MRGLLTPPDEDSSRVSRTYFPPGTTHGLSVPISTAGIAEVSLTGDPDAVDEETAQRMLAQLIWTLRQEPRIRAVELSVGGRIFGSTGGSTQVNLDVGSAYDPNGVRSTGDLFALSDGLLVRGTLGAFDETLGPLGQVDLGLRHIGVNLAGSRVAAVSDDGTEVQRRPGRGPRQPGRDGRRRGAWTCRRRCGTTATGCGSSTATAGGPGCCWSSTDAPARSPCRA